jgi:hypothetical protein
MRNHEALPMTYHGHVRNGMVILDEPVQLPEGAEVTIQLTAHDVPSDVQDDGPTLYERLKPIVGAAKGLPPDASVNVDHYLYGRPKRT